LRGVFRIWEIYFSARINPLLSIVIRERKEMQFKEKKYNYNAKNKTKRKRKTGANYYN